MPNSDSLFFLFFPEWPYSYSLLPEIVLLACFLFCVSIKDVLHLRIENRILLLGLFLALASHVAAGRLHEFSYFLVSSIFIYLFWVFVEYVYRARKKKCAWSVGIGGGDRKLWAILAFWIGWIPAMFAISLSIILAYLDSKTLWKASVRSGREVGKIPFAPAISVGTFLAYSLFVGYWK